MHNIKYNPITLTIKAKAIGMGRYIKPVNHLLINYLRGLQIVSQYEMQCISTKYAIFNKIKLLNYTNLYNHFKHILQDNLQVNSTMEQTICRQVASTYKSTSRQMKLSPKKKFYDNGKVTYRHMRITDLKQPIFCKKDAKKQCVLQKRDCYRFITTSDKHLLLSFDVLKNEGMKTKKNKPTSKIITRFKIRKYFYKYLYQYHKFGAIRLMIKKLPHNHEMLIILISITVYRQYNNYRKYHKHIVASDRGIDNIYFATDKNKHTLHCRGYALRHKYAHYLKTCGILQYKSKFSKSAKRKLKKYRTHFTNFINCKIHNESKKLANFVGEYGVLGLEGLTGIRKALKNSKKKHRFTMVSWAYNSLESKLKYKLALIIAQVVHVNPHDTSIMCVKCNHIDKNNRQHNHHIYNCKHCKKFKTNDDFVGALNNLTLTFYSIKGMRYPTIIKDLNNNGHIIEGSTCKNNKIAHIHGLKKISLINKFIKQSQSYKAK